MLNDVITDPIEIIKYQIGDMMPGILIALVAALVAAGIIVWLVIRAKKRNNKKS